METKMIKRIPKNFYQEWNQVDHITKLAQRLDDDMTYLNTHDGINITEANKLQFYTEQMLGSNLLRQGHHHEVGKAFAHQENVDESEAIL